MSRPRLTTHLSGYFASATCVLTMAVLFTPVLAWGQCQPISSSAKLRPPSPAPQNSSSSQPEFFDEPQFTVAGVTDPTNLGGHGSNTVMRTKEALAKDVASLGTTPGAKQSPESSAQSTAEAGAGVAAKENAERALEAVRAYCTLGEIIGVMKKELGVYAEPTWI